MWDFGDGTSSNVSEPSHVYATPGTYNVTLMVQTAGGCTSNSFGGVYTITVNPIPVAAFAINSANLDLPYDQLVCNNASTGATSYSWSFGDGDTSTSQDPVHTYQALGNQQVSLTAISNFGCTALHDTIFSIEPLPSASFSAGNGCSESRLVLTDASTVNSGSITDWIWDFGNGVQLTGVSPDYGYPQGGNYVIQLTVTTQSGCKDSTTRNVFIQDRPIGAYTVANTCNGLPVQFTDLSTIAGSTIVSRWWSFGDGDTSVLSSPSHTYPAGAGNYPLELIVYAANGCSDTINEDLRISNIPTSSFTSTPSVVCTGTEVQFNDLSTVVGDTIRAGLGISATEPSSITVQQQLLILISLKDSIM